MKYPVEIGFGEFRLSAHLILESLAFVTGYRYFLYLKGKKSDPISESNRIWILIGAAAGAFLFSRLLGALENPGTWMNAENPWLYFFANKTIVGGLLGGLIAVEITKYILGETSSSGDLFTYPLILAMVIGRIGCLSSGVYEPTFGIESTLPWAMNLGDGKLRHPVALYEIVFLCLLWFGLRSIERIHQFQMGVKFKLFMLSYLIFRFFLEYIKPVHFASPIFTSIQLACLCGLVYYYRTLIFILTNPAKLIIHEQRA